MATVTIVAFDGMDLLDVGGPYEVLLTAHRLLERDGRRAPITMQVAATTSRTVTAYGGMGVDAPVALTDIPRTHILVVPGAVDIASLTADATLINEVSRLAEHAAVTLSVCTGAFLLAAAGLLDDCAWTTHHEDVDQLAGILGEGGARRDVRWVDSGKVITAAGLSSGIAGALHVVDRMHGRELAVRTAEQIEYDWDPEGGITEPV